MIKKNLETVKRAAKAAVMFTALSTLGYFAFMSYLNSGERGELGAAITSFCLALFFGWMFLCKKESWFEEKFGDFF